ncbi:MAG: hypothetical protein A3F92_09485 [Candidatus Rokubacteria bacterium RIFCSPLOWO2_12_FULL_71_22]|nr:MAG: hypothetical protein A3F92_09485 [Candidatus Rokubacteria bacterium RIFCSPLOWO2_12_FULL_71_22]
MAGEAWVEVDMERHRKIPDIAGLDDWEMGLLMEMRILKEAGVLTPVIEVMATCLEVLYLEAERQAWQKSEKRREEEFKSQAKRQRLPGKAFQKGYIPLQFKPDNALIRRLIAERTAAGKWLSRLDRELRRDIARSMVEEIAAKARQAGVNACRAYIGATS